MANPVPFEPHAAASLLCNSSVLIVLFSGDEDDEVALPATIAIA
jgi:hypothetical protein